MAKVLSSLSPDFVEAFGRDLYHCSSCNYCVDAVWPERGIMHVCATMEHHTRAPGYSGRGFIEAARALMEGASLDAEALATRVFTCTTCGNCESACPIGLRPASIGQALRQELVEAESLPDALAALRADTIRDGNPYGVARSARGAWATGLPVPAGGAEAPHYFAGCAAAAAEPAEAQAGYELLSRAGARPAIDPSGCCGAPLAEIGCGREANALAAAVAAGLRKVQGEVVIAGYECRRHLEQAAGVEAVSLPAWLLRVWQAGAISLSLKEDIERPLRVSMLETCQLKRRRRDAPATDENAAATLFAALGIETDSAAYPSAHALCCGASGGMPRMQPQASIRMAQARLPPAGIAVTVDPRCSAHLRQAAEGTPVTVYGFAEFLERYCTVTALAPASVADEAAASS
jgi:Fe-S oxidoreductase